MNRLLILISFVLITSCDHKKMCKNLQLDFDNIEKDRLIVQHSNNDTSEVQIILKDGTIRDRYNFNKDCTWNYSYFDNSNVENGLKFGLDIIENEIIGEVGKSIYVVSESFNSSKMNCLGDSIVFLIRVANPVFLKNKLEVAKNQKIITDDYVFNVNKDELALYSIIKDSLTLNYTLFYYLYSEEMDYVNVDTIKFSIKPNICD